MPAPEKATEIKAVLAAVLAFLTALWGWIGWAVIIWACCIILDYISGSAAAHKTGEWSSDIAREGLWHKLGEIFAVLVAALCDIALKVIVSGSGIEIGLPFDTLITPIVLLWYIITELGSIAENAEKLGAKVPKWIVSGLKQYRNKIDNEHEHPPDDADYTPQHAKTED